jgi:hypothetical protein
MTIETNMGAPDGFVLPAKACDRRQLALQQPSILATTDVHGPRILCSCGIRSIALAAIAVLCATSASAADWQMFDQRGNAKSYIDKGSQRRDMTVYTAWLKTVHEKPQKVPRQAGRGMYFHKLQLVKMDCSARTYLIDKVIYSAKDGVVVGSEDAGPRHDPVVPDSPSEKWHAAICGKRGTFQDLADKGIHYQQLEKPKSKWNPFDR